MDLFQALRDSYLTERMSDVQVRELVALAEFVEMQPLTDIVRRNDVSFDLYVLVEGGAEVSLESGDLVSRLKPGAIIGEFAFFEDGHRSATVMSSGRSKLIHLHGDRLKAHIEAKPEVGMALYRNLGKTLCERLRSSNVQVERLVSSL